MKNDKIIDALNDALEATQRIIENFNDDSPVSLAECYPDLWSDYQVALLQLESL